MEKVHRYTDYAVELSLTILAASSAYIVDFSRPWTMAGAVAVFALFGYTAYISMSGFRRESLVSLTALLFAPLGPLMAVGAGIVASGNVFVSVFSGGGRFRDFYASTRIPLLFMGIIAGASFFALSSSSQDFHDTVQNRTALIVGQQAEKLYEQSDFFQNRRERLKYDVNRTVKETVRLTQNVVLRDLRDENLSRTAMRKVLQSFQRARYNISSIVMTEWKRRAQRLDNITERIDIQDPISEMVRKRLHGKYMAVFVPFIVLLAVSLQPVVGLMTAFFAYLFSRIDAAEF
ncbi:MAG: hypothetical protein ABEK01_02520 [Candidatus Nanohaloarchaea archaeon]